MDSRVPQGLWDLPGAGIEPVSPALAGRFLIVGPPGKPQDEFRNLARQWIFFLILGRGYARFPNPSDSTLLLFFSPTFSVHLGNPKGDENYLLCYCSRVLHSPYKQYQTAYLFPVNSVGLILWTRFSHLWLSGYLYLSAHPSCPGHTSSRRSLRPPTWWMPITHELNIKELIGDFDS